MWTDPEALDRVLSLGLGQVLVASARAAAYCLAPAFEMLRREMDQRLFQTCHHSNRHSQELSGKREMQVS